MVDLAVLSVFLMLGTGVHATKSESPVIRALGKALCVLSALWIVPAIALVCWVVVALEMSW